jgi:hypothetical protein
VRLFRRYKKTDLEAVLLPDGWVEFQKQSYDTSSAAAEAARATVTGQQMNTNGWSFWQFDPGDRSVKTLEEVRTAFLESKKASG